MIPPAHYPRKPSALSDPQPHTEREKPEKKLQHPGIVLTHCASPFCGIYSVFFHLRHSSEPSDVQTLWLFFSFFFFFLNSTHVFLSLFVENWVMITSPTVSILRNSTNPAWHSGSSGDRGAVNSSRPSVYNSVSPADPSRQASRLPIKILKMLTARAGHILHPEYLQPLPSTPVSPIEVRTAAMSVESFAHNTDITHAVVCVGHKAAVPMFFEVIFYFI